MIGDGGSLAAAREAFTTKAIAAPVSLGSGAFEPPGRGVCRVFFEADTPFLGSDGYRSRPAGQRLLACAAEAMVK
jgi:hypothetical protein